MNNAQAVEQIYREFQAHWGVLAPLTFEGMAFNPSDPSMVPDKAAGWARLSVEVSEGSNQALGVRLFRQNATVRVRCFVQSGTGVLRALGLADHALFYFQRGSNGIRFFEIGLIKIGDRQGWFEVIAQCRARFDAIQ